MLTVRMLIDGKLVDSGERMTVINPATEGVAGSCPRATATDVDAAISGAKAAFPGWSNTPVETRRAELIAIGGTMEAHVEELARLLTAEQGKPIANARMEVLRAAGAFNHVAGFDLPGEQGNGAASGLEIRRRPLGVVAAIVPWNFPLMLMAAKLPYALLTGNTVVLKPAPTTPLTTLRIAELVKDILPPGVLNTISEAGDVGPLLTAHPDVAKISFTGSTETGRKVMATASQSLKRLTLELGGNDAAIVLDDVDIGAVAPRLFEAAFRNSGQLCAAVKRVYVHDSIHDALCDRLVALAEAAVVGDGSDPATTFGPIQNRAQYDRVVGMVERAAQAGRVLTGGVLEGTGFFVRPTLVADLDDDAELVREEQFGPVLPVLRFSNDRDAVQRANASPYGLGGSIWSSNPERAHALALGMECGTVWINKHAEMSHNIPFAGAKQSGFGVEMGHQGLEEFTQLHVINAAA